jgi:hypothetical protein
MVTFVNGTFRSDSMAPRATLSAPPARLDGVGGGVFTSRIEHIFEQRLIQVMLEV